MKNLIIILLAIMISCDKKSDSEISKTSEEKSKSLEQVLKESPEISENIRQNIGNKSTKSCLAIVGASALGGVVAAESITKGCELGGVALVPITGGSSFGATIICGAIDISQIDAAAGAAAGSIFGLSVCAGDVIKKALPNIQVSQVFQIGAKPSKRSEEYAAGINNNYAGEGKIASDCGFRITGEINANNYVAAEHGSQCFSPPNGFDELFCAGFNKFENDYGDDSKFCKCMQHGRWECYDRFFQGKEFFNPFE